MSFSGSVVVCDQTLSASISAAFCCSTSTLRAHAGASKPTTHRIQTYLCIVSPPCVICLPRHQLKQSGPGGEPTEACAHEPSRAAVPPTRGSRDLRASATGAPAVDDLTVVAGTLRPAEVEGL